MNKRLKQITFTVDDETYEYIKKKPRGWLRKKLQELSRKK